MVSTFDSMVSITCSCGHEDDFLEFRKAPVTGELPAGNYQCPKCLRAWAVKREAPRVGWSGMVIPGKSQTVQIPAVL